MFPVTIPADATCDQIASVARLMRHASAGTGQFAAPGGQGAQPDETLTG